MATTGLLPQWVPDGEQLVLRPAGQRDSDAAACGCEILSGQLPYEAGRAVQDDVEVTLGCAHTGDATRAPPGVRRPHPARDEPGNRSRPGTRSWHAAARAPSGSPKGSRGIGVGWCRPRLREGL